MTQESNMLFKENIKTKEMVIKEAKNLIKEVNCYTTILNLDMKGKIAYVEVEKIAKNNIAESGKLREMLAYKTINEEKRV